MSKQRRIPAGQSGTYAAWILPSVTQGVGVSARELEAIVLDAAREGRRDGRGEGYAEAIVGPHSCGQDGHRDGRGEGYAEGRQEGFAAGHTEGLAAGRKYLEEAAGRFAGLLEALHRPLLGQEQELRDALLEVVEQIARAVIRAELALQPGRVAHLIEEALAALPLGARNVRVHVSPADRALLEDFGAGEAVPVLLVDATLEPGDCRVESAESLVDFRQSVRFASIIDQFLGRSSVPGGRE